MLQPAFSAPPEGAGHEKMVNPWNILAITFTNKAAKEMRERALALTPRAQDTLIATFHSMCVRILRRDADHIGYNRNFTIIDPGDQKSLMKRILKEANLDPKKWEPKGLLNTISNAKNDLIDETAYAKHKLLLDTLMKWLLRVFIRFTKRNCAKQNQWILMI